MDLQQACEILEDLSELESLSNKPKLNMEEFMALQMVLLDLQISGKYNVSEYYKF